MVDMHTLNTMHPFELLNPELPRTWDKTLPCRLRRSSAAWLWHGSDFLAGVADRTLDTAGNRWYTACLTQPKWLLLGVVPCFLWAGRTATSAARWICTCDTPSVCLHVARQWAGTVRTLFRRIAMFTKPLRQVLCMVGVVFGGGARRNLHCTVDMHMWHTMCLPLHCSAKGRHSWHIVAALQCWQNHFGRCFAWLARLSGRGSPQPPLNVPASAFFGKGLPQYSFGNFSAWHGWMPFGGVAPTTSTARRKCAGNAPSPWSCICMQGVRTLCAGLGCPLLLSYAAAAHSGLGCCTVVHKVGHTDGFVAIAAQTLFCSCCHWGDGTLLAACSSEFFGFFSSPDLFRAKIYAVFLFWFSFRYHTCCMLSEWWHTSNSIRSGRLARSGNMRRNPLPWASPWLEGCSASFYTGCKSDTCRLTVHGTIPLGPRPKRILEVATVSLVDAVVDCNRGKTTWCHDSFACSACLSQIGSWPVPVSAFRDALLRMCGVQLTLRDKTSWGRKVGLYTNLRFFGPLISTCTRWAVPRGRSWHPTCQGPMCMHPGLPP